jgi:hypothetical protein
MSKLYRSVRGKSIDIDKIKLTNETVNAVGNMKVNARGDQIGAGGQIAQGRNQIMDQVYAVADAPYSPNDPTNFAQQQAVVENTKAQQLHDMVQGLTKSGPIEQPAAAAPARGSLASSVAKPVAVNQQAAPTPQQQKKAQGPSRI